MPLNAILWYIRLVDQWNHRWLTEYEEYDVYTKTRPRRVMAATFGILIAGGLSLGLAGCNGDSQTPQEPTKTLVPAEKPDLKDPSNGWQKSAQTLTPREKLLQNLGSTDDMTV